MILYRLSIGLENSDDLIEDLSKGLDRFIISLGGILGSLTSTFQSPRALGILNKNFICNDSYITIVN